MKNQFSSLFIWHFKFELYLCDSFNANETDILVFDMDFLYPFDCSYSQG